MSVFVAVFSHVQLGEGLVWLAGIDENASQVTCSNQIFLGQTIIIVALFFTTATLVVMAWGWMPCVHDTTTHWIGGWDTPRRPSTCSSYRLLWSLLFTIGNIFVYGAFVATVNACPVVGIHHHLKWGTSTAYNTVVPLAGIGYAALVIPRPHIIGIFMLCVSTVGLMIGASIGVPGSVWCLVGACSSVSVLVYPFISQDELSVVAEPHTGRRAVVVRSPWGMWTPGEPPLSHRPCTHILESAGILVPDDVDRTGLLTFLATAAAWRDAVRKNGDQRPLGRIGIWLNEPRKNHRSARTGVRVVSDSGSCTVHGR
jgi:hypothetical protein